MYIAIIIYMSESLGHDLRMVAGPENFRPSGGVCTVIGKVGGVTEARAQPQSGRDLYCSSRPLPVVGIRTGKYVDLYNKSFSGVKFVPAALVRRP